MRTLVPGYYILDEPKRRYWSEYIRELIVQFNWILTFILRRIIINIALGPDEVRLQKPIHVQFFSEDRTEKGAVVVNVLPGRSDKNPRSYYDTLPQLSSLGKRQLSFNNPVHKAYVDSIIEEIGCLIQGKSTYDKCTNKHFAIEDIHIKGMERLDDHLAQYFKEQVRHKYHHDFFERPRKINMDFFTLETPDNAVLESVEVSDIEEQLKPMAERKFVIVCMARNQNYMYWLKDFYITAKKIGCTVVGFNYRGIDYSKGMIWTQDNMVQDVLAQARRLLESGVRPEHIAFEGMSLGAAIATLSAAEMHDKGLKVQLYNERSYRSLVRLIVGYVMPKSNCNLWNPLNWLSYMLVGLTYLFIAPLIWLAGWHIDAASAWDRIPSQYKVYSVARNHQNPERYDDDDLVHDSFSSIASLMAEHLEVIKQKQKNGQPLSIDEERQLADNAESHEFTLDRNNKTNNNPSSHSAPRRFLFDTQHHKKTMHEYMIEHLGDMLDSGLSKHTQPLR
ncbi:hypothetical protein [Legionella quateirensis]|uniref:SdbA protein, substrate of the Dot/Icm system n=1 Tax=Legionella quateirensis TaxID=45072 RepID=A0A378KXI5_9GAMM|nr:hypothetical protein [Legionella quateirensis]KTD48359.1 SdbA protein, substrate of the Dot/Icm system [Legionella quateirensis]STY18311.1 SdbA protein, substrate of the Dot/Icm system [Legionella quateirensis]